MTKESFEKMDQAWMEKLKTERQRKVPWEILKGFSASVEKRILQKQARPSFGLVPSRAWAPVVVPVLAVMVLASVAVLRLPLSDRGAISPSGAIQLAQANNTSEVDEEIAALKELGAWTEEDEQALGVGDQSILEDSELSRGIPSGEKQLA